MSKNSQTRRTKPIEGFSHRALTVPSTGHSANIPATYYNSTVDLYTEDEYLDLKIDFRFSIERGRRG